MNFHVVCFSNFFFSLYDCIILVDASNVWSSLFDQNIFKNRVMRTYYLHWLSKATTDLKYSVPFKPMLCCDIQKYLTLSWPAGHICPTYKESFQVRWDNSISFFLHAAIYLEVSLFRWTSQNAFSRETAVYKLYCVQCCIAAHDRFAGKCILTGSME